MSIGIIGNGFVGSAILHGFMLHAEDIMIYDNNPKISTHTLEELVSESKVVFVCVPTPMYESGECDLSIIESVVDQISSGIDPSGTNYTISSCDTKKSGQVIVIKSTVVPGTVEGLAQKYPDLSFVFNPEFLTERKARLDFINTARIVLGGEDSDSLKTVEDLYRVRFPYTKIIKTDFGTAQLIKYMANCFFATKVSFMNEMHQICKALDGDWDLKALFQMVGLEILISMYLVTTEILVSEENAFLKI